jgi:phage tail-like protein
MAFSTSSLGALGDMGAAALDKGQGVNTSFEIQIDGISQLTFQSCEGLEAEIEVVTLHEGGNLGAPRTARGHQNINRISFGQGTTSSEHGKSIFEWFQDVCDAGHPLEKKSISIKLKNPDKQCLAEWQVHNAWPCRWTAPMMLSHSSGVAIEYVTFTHEGIERKK